MTRLGPLRPELSAPLHALQSEFQRLLGQYRHLIPLGPTPVEGEGPEPGAWAPAVDLRETDDALVLVVDLPGVDPATVDLSVTGRTLTLRGRRPAEPGADDGERLARERPCGPFYRRIDLPCDVDLDAAEAEAELGVLRVRLPRAGSDRPRSIPIRPS